MFMIECFAGILVCVWTTIRLLEPQSIGKILLPSMHWQKSYRDQYDRQKHFQLSTS